jgi:hypothetical protein
MTKIGTAVAFAIVAAFAIVMLMTPSVSHAKGCIKGALVGGVAGHYAGHHGVLGAAAGCIIGRHQAHAAQKQRQQQASPNANR